MEPLIYSLSCACLALTFRRYLIQDGGLLSWWPGIVYKLLPVKYEDWNGMQKAIEKIFVTCATCQAGQLAFWIQIAQGKGVVDALLCTGFASMAAHWLDQKLF